MPNLRHYLTLINFTNELQTSLNVLVSATLLKVAAVCSAVLCCRGSGLGSDGVEGEGKWGSMGQGLRGQRLKLSLHESVSEVSRQVNLF